MDHVCLYRTQMSCSLMSCSLKSAARGVLLKISGEPKMSKVQHSLYPHKIAIKKAPF